MSGVFEAAMRSEEMEFDEFENPSAAPIARANIYSNRQQASIINNKRYGVSQQKRDIKILDQKKLLASQKILETISLSRKSHKTRIMRLKPNQTNIGNFERHNEKKEVIIKSLDSLIQTEEIKKDSNLINNNNNNNPMISNSINLLLQECPSIERIIRRDDLLTVSSQVVSNQIRIMKAKSSSELLNIIDECHSSFDMMNATTCIFRLGKLVRDGEKISVCEDDRLYKLLKKIGGKINEIRLSFIQSNKLIHNSISTINSNILNNTEIVVPFSNVPLTEQKDTKEKTNYREDNYIQQNFFGLVQTFWGLVKLNYPLPFWTSDLLDAISIGAQKLLPQEIHFSDSSIIDISLNQLYDDENKNKTILNKKQLNNLIPSIGILSICQGLTALSNCSLLAQSCEWKKALVSLHEAAKTKVMSAWSNLPRDNAECVKISPIAVNDLASITSALARNRIRDVEIFTAVSDLVRYSLEEADVDNITSLAWSFASNKFSDKLLFSKIRSVIYTRISEFRPRNLVSITWSLSRVLEHRDDISILTHKSYDRGTGQEVFTTLLAPAIRSYLLEFTCKDVCKIIWSFSNAGIVDYEFLREMRHLLRPKIKDMNCADLTSVVVSMTLHRSINSLTNGIVQQSTEIDESMINRNDIINKSTEVSTYNGNYEIDSIKSKVFMDPLKSQAIRLSELFTSLQITRCIHGFACLGVKDKKLYERLCDRVLGSMHSFYSKNIYEILSAFPILGYFPLKYIVPFLDFLRPHVDNLSPEECIGLLRFFSALQSEVFPSRDVVSLPLSTSLVHSQCEVNEPIGLLISRQLIEAMPREILDVLAPRLSGTKRWMLTAPSLVQLLESFVSLNIETLYLDQRSFISILDQIGPLSKTTGFTGDLFISFCRLIPKLPLIMIEEITARMEGCLGPPVEKLMKDCLSHIWVEESDSTRNLIDLLYFCSSTSFFPMDVIDRLIDQIEISIAKFGGLECPETFCNFIFALSSLQIERDTKEKLLSDVISVDHCIREASSKGDNSNLVKLMWSYAVLDWDTPPNLLDAFFISFKNELPNESFLLHFKQICLYIEERLEVYSKSENSNSNSKEKEKEKEKETSWISHVDHSDFSKFANRMTVLDLGLNKSINRRKVKGFSKSSLNANISTEWISSGLFAARIKHSTDHLIANIYRISAILLDNDNDNCSTNKNKINDLKLFKVFKNDNNSNIIRRGIHVYTPGDRLCLSNSRQPTIPQGVRLSGLGVLRLRQLLYLNVSIEGISFDILAQKGRTDEIISFIEGLKIIKRMRESQ